MDIKKAGLNNIHTFGDMIYKVYFFEDLLKRQDKVINVMNEYAVSKLAKEQNL